MKIAKERQRFIGYQPAVHNMSLETRHKIIEGNELRKLQETDEVWKEVINYRMPKLKELRGKVQKVLRQLFNPMLFVIHNGILCYKRHSDPT